MEVIVKMTEKSLVLKKQRPDELLLLALINNKEKELFNSLIIEYYYLEALIKLKEKGLIKTSISISTNIKIEEIEAVKSLKELYLKPTIANMKSGVAKWIKEYRDLFPKGMNPNGYPFKGDKKGCTNNMAKFLYNYPEFNNKELILKATGIYIEQKKKDNYAYIAMADRFIWKNDMSTLASYCEQLKEGTLKDEKRNVINL